MISFSTHPFSPKNDTLKLTIRPTNYFTAASPSPRSFDDPKPEGNQETNLRPIGLSHLASAFILLVGLIFVALVAFMVELATGRKAQHK